uniref:Uncharacterized protein n=1 Tax=Arundo donax TaxID=35708 RepID=A0A0A9AYE2_ARUDO
MIGKKGPWTMCQYAQRAFHKNTELFNADWQNSHG